MSQAPSPARSPALLVTVNVVVLAIAAAMLGRLARDSEAGRRAAEQRSQALSLELLAQRRSAERAECRAESLGDRIGALHAALELGEERSRFRQASRDLRIRGVQRLALESQATAEARAAEQLLALQRSLGKQQRQLIELSHRTQSPAARTRRLMRHTVRINAKSEVGSGVIIYNDRRLPGAKLETYILTAYHVIKENMKGGGGKLSESVQVDLYQARKRRTPILARVVAVQTQFDLALLRVSGEIIAPACRPALDSELAKLQLCDPVTAIGCPLGYEPMPTRGELMSTSKSFDGHEFWMMNAATIFGNSGGGIFDGRSGALIGILVRIGAYKNVIDVAVPHLGIVTPMSTVRNWLKERGLSWLLATSPKAIGSRTAPVQAGHQGD